MGDWSIFPNISMADWYPVVDGGSSYWTQIDTANAGNTKGNFTPIISSTPYDCILCVQVSRFNYAGDFLIDVAVGDAGSESVIVSNILFSRASSAQYALTQRVLIPKIIPSGTRISMRCQSTRTSTNSIFVNIGCHRIGSFLSGDFASKITTYGDAAGDSGGTALDPGGSANTKGSWVEITSGLAFNTVGFYFCIGSQYNGNVTTGSWSMDLGIGGAGSEEIIVASFPITCYNNNHLFNPCVSEIFWIPIPAGTRFAARVQSSITDATDRVIDFVLYGIS